MTTTNATNFGFRATDDKSHRPRASGRRFLFGTHRNKYMNIPKLQIHANSPKFASWCWKVSQRSNVDWLTGVPIVFKGIVFVLHLYTSAMLTSSLGATIFCWPWSLEAAAHGSGLRDRLVNNLNRDLSDATNRCSWRTLTHFYTIKHIFYFSLTFLRLQRCKAKTCLDSPLRCGLSFNLVRGHELASGTQDGLWMPGESHGGRPFFVLAISVIRESYITQADLTHITRMKLLNFQQPCAQSWRLCWCWVSCMTLWEIMLHYSDPDRFAALPMLCKQMDMPKVSVLFVYLVSKHKPWRARRW